MKTSELKKPMEKTVIVKLDPALFDNKMSARELSEKAHEISRLATLWLEHPFTAHQAHEMAVSAFEQIGDTVRAAEHRRAAEFWAKKELEWDNPKHPRFGVKSWRSN